MSAPADKAWFPRPGKGPLQDLYRWAVVLLSGLLAITSAVQAEGRRIVVTPPGDAAALHAAVRTAAPGDVVHVPAGHYRVHVVIDKSLVLEGEGPGTVIDGGGKDSVITIRASGVILRGLEVIRSGPIPWADAVWAPAGIVIEADDVTVSACDIHDNAVGILVRDVRHTYIQGNAVHDNAHIGILQLAGGHSQIVENRIADNGNGGIGLVKSAPEVPNHWRSVFTGILREPSDDVIRDNVVENNSRAGILMSGTARTHVTGNLVVGTRCPLEDDAANLMANPNPPELEEAGRQIERRVLGAGIAIACGSHDFVIADNEVRNSCATGIVLDLADHGRIEHNRVMRNADGILLMSSPANRICGNALHANTGTGIGLLLRPGGDAIPTGGCLIVANDLVDNGRNACDETSARVAENRQALKEYRRIMRSMAHDHSSMAAVRRHYIRNILRSLETAGHPNFWDNGRIGNHWDDFDELQEGFRDRNGDGIGERPRRVPCGRRLDRHPLAAPPAAPACEMSR